jgi:hypothetical protein
MLPDLNDDEIAAIRDKGKVTITDPDRLPKTWIVMYDLWARQLHEGGLTEEEVEYITIFGELPVPYGLLKDHERCISFVDRLDQIWRAMEVAAVMTGSNRLLEIDLQKYNESQGVSAVDPKERNYQQYQLFEAWSRLILPCIPLIHRQQALFAASVDSGTKVLSYLISMWQSIINSDNIFHFNLIPDVSDLAIDEFEDLLKSLRENDAKVDDWIDAGELKALLQVARSGGENGEFGKAYAKIIRRGFRRLFGVTNVGVEFRRKKKEDDGTVRVKLVGLKRLIMLACVRRINLECDVVAEFNRDKFSIISKFRSCHLLVGLVPSEQEIGDFCGMDLY